MAVCMPFPLWQRTSRVYQDLLPFGWVLTSFVPPAHKQGASPAPLQGPCPPDKIPAGYWLILCLIVSDQPHSYTSTFRRTFPDALTLLSLPARDRNRISVLTAARFWPRAVIAVNFRSSLSDCLCCKCHRPLDISDHLCRIIFPACCQQHVEQSDQLACYCDHRLHLLQRILIPCRVIMMDAFELRAV